MGKIYLQIRFFFQIRFLYPAKLSIKLRGKFSDFSKHSQIFKIDLQGFSHGLQSSSPLCMHSPPWKYHLPPRFKCYRLPILCFLSQLNVSKTELISTSSPYLLYAHPQKNPIPPADDVS